MNDSTAQSIHVGVVSAEDCFRTIEIDEASSVSRQVQAPILRCAKNSLHVGFQFLLIEKQGEGHLRG